MSDSDGTTERFADDARRFRLDGRIATGGMGEVWRATDTSLGRAVAVMIQNAPGTARGEIAGGALGGPIAKAVMEAVIK